METIKGYDGTLYGNYRTPKFTDVYNDIDSFMTDYKGIGIPAIVNDTDVTTLYYLLYAYYGNSRIASSDENRFKYNLFSIIWQYGPTWSKEVEIQAKLRSLKEEELLEGARAIHNTAANPSVDPSNFTDEELQFINAQDVSKYKKGKLEGYSILMELLKRDVTSTFLEKFKKLFLTIVEPELPLWYISEDENGDK